MLSNRPYATSFGLASLAVAARAARLRAVALALCVSVALASVAHFAHSHEGESPSIAKLCALCWTFERGAAPPPSPHGVEARPTPGQAPAPARDSFVTATARRPSQPRAPPVTPA